MVRHDTDKQAKIAGGQAVRKGGGMIQAIQEEAAKTAYSDLETIQKAALTRIDVSSLPKEKPDFDMPGETKDGLIAEWLKAWITAGLATGALTEQNLLPRKADIAKYLGISIGTVQNAIRFIEDEGFVQSKQRIGTIISNPENQSQRLRKLTSKRDLAVVAIKQLILNKALTPGQALPSAREVAKLIGSAPNTTRLALEFLSSQGIVENRGTRGNKANWFLDTVPALSDDETVKPIVSETLIDQVERDLKQLIASNFEVGDKMPSHLELAETLKVSIKTVHDAMCRVVEQGIVQSRRGRYGSFIMRKPDADKLFSVDEAASIFMPAEQAVFYNYEKVENHLKGMIAKSTKVGDKLPSMTQLASDLDVSSNTIRKALMNLAKEGFVRFERGRQGGTFVTNLPTITKQDEKAYAWVSINPQSLSTYRKKAAADSTLNV